MVLKSQQDLGLDLNFIRKKQQELPLGQLLLFEKYNGRRCLVLILGLNGSPKRDADADVLLKKSLLAAEKEGAETLNFSCSDLLKDLVNPFCTACSSPCGGYCFKNKSLEPFFELCKRADGIIISSPVYFGTVSGQLKALWDKTQILRQEKALLNVVGGALTVGAYRFGGQETTIKAIFDMMTVQGMIIVGNGDDGASDCGHQGASAQMPAADDLQALESAAVVGARVAKVAQATQVLRKR